MSPRLSQRQGWPRRTRGESGRLCLLTLAAWLCVSLAAACATAPPNAGVVGGQVTPPAFKVGGDYFPSGPIHVQGSLLADATGHTFLLHGAQIPSTLNVQQPDHAELLAAQHLDRATFSVMRQQWNMNAVRIPTCDALWHVDPSGYLASLDRVVKAANAARLVVVLDLHEDQRCGAPTGNRNFMLPLPEARTYWQAVAAHYRANPDVIFDVYNEPTLGGDNGIPTAADWRLWQHGGTEQGVRVVGMQDLVDAIRATGAAQLVMVEGLDGAATFAGIGVLGIADANVAYEIHVYFTPGALTSAQWDAAFGFLSGRYPIYVGEWAFLPNAYYPYLCRSVSHDQADQEVVTFMRYLDVHNFSWTAWAFIPKKLIRDYTHYTPTTLDTSWTCGDITSSAGMGALVEQHLLAYH